ncbi:hypothetical protein TorRG33x02_352150 [Trema orientale]|uniref:Transmembrane protein n=1 Tax=Trema orientale TaxID=63057 RepID=A0A2P5AEY9_TREOI|nr:hypothetical protein TorRG33x02_352150 [Trema orientale]
METENNGAKVGLSHRAILIHSLSLTFFGVVLFRLGTANTQSLVYAQIFAISGALIATVPWLAQFAVSTAAILLYRAGVCDLSWLVRSGSESMEAAAVSGGGSGCRGSTAVVVEIENDGAHGYNGKIDQGGKNESENEGLDAKLAGVSGRRIGPQLQRNKTV